MSLQQVKVGMWTGKVLTVVRPADWAIYAQSFMEESSSITTIIPKPTASDPEEQQTQHIAIEIAAWYNSKLCKNTRMSISQVGKQQVEDQIRAQIARNNC